MNTNDPEAPYGDKHTERAPLLSDEDIEYLVTRFSRQGNEPGYVGPSVHGGYLTGIEEGMGMGRAFYEGRITSGELRAYKNLGTRLTPNGTLCNACDRWLNVAYDRYCPGCGEKVSE